MGRYHWPLNISKSLMDSWDEILWIVFLIKLFNWNYCKAGITLPLIGLISWNHQAMYFNNKNFDILEQIENWFYLIEKFKHVETFQFEQFCGATNWFHASDTASWFAKSDAAQIISQRHQWENELL